MKQSFITWSTGLVLLLSLLGPAHAQPTTAAAAPTRTASATPATTTAAAPATPASGKRAAAAPASPKVVDVGIYLNNIPSVNLKEKKFQADFNIWFRWTGDEINPLDSFELVNGHIESKEGPVKKKIGDVNYGAYRIVATIHRNFQLSKYPLDDHALKIQVEDAVDGGAETVFRADTKYAGISPKIDVPGWSIGKFESYASVTKYATNFGDISNAASESRYPRYTMSVELKRSGIGNFVKLFSMLFLAAGLALCAFRVRSDYIDARIALAASGVFLGVLTQNTLATSLPESDSFGMADQLYNLTMLCIGIVFLVCIRAFKLQLAGDEDRAHHLSRRFGMGLSAAYVIGTGAIIAAAS